MRSTEAFKVTVEAKLQEMGAADPLFSANLQKEGKSIDDCITYILNCVKQSGCNGFTDDEIFGMAAHYYDEDTIDIGKPVNCDVVVNHLVELTPEEIQSLKDEAKKKVIDDELQRLSKKVPPKKVNPTEVQQPNLFSL